jgi:soluble lytic murein transglycosylase
MGYGGYWGYLWCRAYYEEHEELKKQVASNAVAKKYVRDIEKTLKVNYEFLSKYEAHYYALMFNDFGQAYGIPWEVYAALVRIESNFDPTQKSDKDAKGMTQVIESTGKATAAKMGLHYKENETLWNDLLNMMIGFTYFSEGYRSRLNEGASRDEAIQHAIKRYLGGSGYASEPKKPSSPTNHGKEKRIYVSEYNISVWQEYRKLQYVFKGVCADTSNIIHDSVIDTLVTDE